MSIDKAENTTVRYTEDGTDPDVSSTKAETNSVSFYSNTPEFKEVRFAAFDEAEIITDSLPDESYRNCENLTVVPES